MKDSTKDNVLYFLSMFAGSLVGQALFQWLIKPFLDTL